MSVPACSKAVRPEAPVVDTAPIPKPSLSLISLAIEIPLEKLRAAADEQIEPVRATKFKHCEGGGLGKGGWCASFDFTPGPLSITADGHEIEVSFDLDYGIALKFSKGPPAVKCKDRSASISLTTTWDVDAEWTPVVKTTTHVKPKNKCELKMMAFKADTTGLIMKFFRKTLRKAAAKLDAEVAGSLELRKRMEEAWQRLQEPMEVGVDQWLSTAPQELRMGPVVTTAETITLHFAMTAFPVLRLGSRPPSGTESLPDLTKGPVDDAFRITIPIEIPYADVQKQVDELLRKSGGKLRYPPEGKRYIEITDVHVEGFGAQVIVILKFAGTGRLEGVAYLRGTPTYDAETNVLSFPDLEFSGDTNKVLFDAYLWLKKKKIRNTLREKLKVDITAALAKAKKGLDEALNKPYKGVALSGGMDELRLLGLWADPTSKSFVTYVRLKGKLRASLR